MDVINILPIELQNKIFYYLIEPCAEIFRKSNFCTISDIPRPLFRNLNYIGFRPCKLNQIDKDFSEYWEPYLIYDSDSETYEYYETESENDTDNENDLLNEESH
jgi:hypothetical protein